MFEFRNTNSTYSIDTVARPSGLTELQIISECCAYVYGYIFNYNVVRTPKKTLKKELILLIPIIEFCILIMLNAGRGTALMMIMQLLVLLYVLYQQYNGWKVNFSYKFIAYLFAVLMLIMVVFSATRYIVGRMNSLNTFEYISQYAGAAIKNLDLFLQDKIAKEGIWGKETFGAIHNQLSSVLGIPEWSYIRHLEFRFVNGVGLGNVYGAIRSYYHDFGIIGTCLIVALTSFVMTSLYYKARHIPKWTQRSAFSFITFIFCYLEYAMFMYPIAESFVNLVVTRANIKLLIELYIFKSLIIDKGFLRFKVGSKQMMFKNTRGGGNR